MRTTLRILSIILILSLLAACAPAPTAAPIPTTTPTPPPTATPQPTAVVYRVSEPAEAFTPAQEALNTAESTIQQKTAIERWLNYWVHLVPPPFDPQSTQLTWKYLYDDPNNPTNVFLMLEAGGQYNGRLFTIPIGADGKFVDFPPEVSGQDIQPGFGPLELSAGGEGMWLSVNENGIPVRRDGTGTIVQTLNMETRQWEVVDSRWETPDASLVEQINSAMPVMWTYNRETKTFVEVPTNGFSFSIFERTTLFIKDENGNEIGYARRFLKSVLDSENTEYFSLTDKSTNSLIPIKLYAQMGDFNPSTDGFNTSQCMFAFSENMATFPGPFNQNLIDRTNKYALDIAQISDGEEMMQAALIRTVAMIKGVSEDQIKLDLKNGTPVVVSIGGQDWEVNKGVDFIWNNSYLPSFEVIDGRFVSYDGVGSRTASCPSFSVGRGLFGMFGKVFGREIAYAYLAGMYPVLSLATGRTPEVTAIRDK